MSTYYTDLLKKCETAGISILRAHIAEETEYFLKAKEIEYTADDFENCCEFVYDYFDHSEVLASQIAQALVEVLIDKDNDFSFRSFDSWEEEEKLLHAVEDYICAHF